MFRQSDRTLWIAFNKVHFHVSNLKNQLCHGQIVAQYVKQNLNLRRENVNDDRKLI